MEPGCLRGADRLPTILYTMIGGVQAVTWADVKQMMIIVVAVVAVVIVLLLRIPVGPDDALRVAGAAGRLRTFDFSFDLTQTYTFWSGLIGGAFLMLSYFGTDQSQVQRYLTARSVDEARTSLLISAYWKIPLQAVILLLGVLVFVFYLFKAPPLLYNPAHEQRGPRREARGVCRPRAAVCLRHQRECRRGAGRRRPGTWSGGTVQGAPGDVLDGPH
jgi:Na+/proline symporter